MLLIFSLSRFSFIFLLPFFILFALVTIKNSHALSENDLGNMLVAYGEGGWNRLDTKNYKNRDKFLFPPMLLMIKKKGSKYSVCQTDERDSLHQNFLKQELAKGTSAELEFLDYEMMSLLCYKAKPLKLKNHPRSEYFDSNDKFSNGLLFIDNPKNNFEALKRKNIIQEPIAKKFIKELNKLYTSKEPIDLKIFTMRIHEILEGYGKFNNIEVNDVINTLVCGGHDCIYLYNNHFFKVQWKFYQTNPKEYPNPDGLYFFHLTNSNYFNSSEKMNNFVTTRLFEKNQGNKKNIQVESVASSNTSIKTQSNSNIKKVETKVIQNNTSVSTDKTILSKKELKEELRYWKEMLDEGLISQKDYDKEKKSLLNNGIYSKKKQSTNSTTSSSPNNEGQKVDMSYKNKNYINSSLLNQKKWSKIENYCNSSYSRFTEYHECVSQNTKEYRMYSKAKNFYDTYFYYGDMLSLQVLGNEINESQARYYLNNKRWELNDAYMEKKRTRFNNIVNSISAVNNMLYNNTAKSNNYNKSITNGHKLCTIRKSPGGGYWQTHRVDCH